MGDNILRSKAARVVRKKHYTNICEVKNIGIVWDASKTDEFPLLTKFYQRMAESKTDVSILGYYSGKSLPNQYTAVRYLSILKREELNMFYHPVSGESNSFVNKPFDVLIDINFNKLQPLHYISSMSNASLKVGLFESKSKNTPFDLMMDLKNPVNIEDYLNHVVHYLGMINSRSVN